MKVGINDKGKTLQDKMCSLHESVIQKMRIELNNDDYDEGWTVIDNDDYIKTLEDEIALLLYGYDGYAVDVVQEWINEYGADDYIDINGKLYTHREVYDELMKYFER